jgi:hypothetical protein
MRYAQINRAGEVLVFLHGDPAQWPDLVAADALRSCGANVDVGWVWTGEGFVPPPPEPARKRIIPPLEFRRRLVADERASITLAASRGLEQGDATLQLWLDDLNSATEVDLDSPVLRQGLDLLVHAGLLPPARIGELLA